MSDLVRQYVKRYNREPNEIHINEAHLPAFNKLYNLSLIKTDPLTLKDSSNRCNLHFIVRHEVKRISCRYNPDRAVGYTSKRVVEYNDGSTKITKTI